MICFYKRIYLVFLDRGFKVMADMGYEILVIGYIGNLKSKGIFWQNKGIDTLTGSYTCV